MPDDTAPAGAPSGSAPSGGTQAGTAQPAGPSAGQTPPAGGQQDGGSQGDTPKSLWDKATDFYRPKIQKLEEELADYRKRYAANEAKAKTAEQLASELEAKGKIEDRRMSLVAESAQAAMKNLPEHLRDLLKKSAGDDPYRQLELLPQFQDLATKTQLKTIGGTQSGNGQVQIDYKSIQEAADRGNTQPMRDAIAKHGKPAYDAGLQTFLLQRGR